MNFIWDEAAIETVSAMWKRGMSGTEIAAALGDGLTKNAVIGKINRLGLNLRDTGYGATHYKQKAAAKEKSKPFRPIPAVPFAPRIEREPRIPVDPNRETAFIGTGRVAFLDRREGQCAWPYGDPKELDEFRFCGARTAKDGAPYCCGHMKLAYQPDRQRKFIVPFRRTRIRACVE